jgi:hypothetical protein
MLVAPGGKERLTFPHFRPKRTCATQQDLIERLRLIAISAWSPEGNGAVIDRPSEP